MNAEEKKRYDNFVTRLNGKPADGKNPFKDYSSAMKALPHLQVSQKVKDELKDLVAKKYGREEGSAPPKPTAKQAAGVPSLTTLFDGLPSSEKPSRQPVYGTIPAGVSAKLEFLTAAIQNNAQVIHGLMEAKLTDPNADVSEIQDAINRLNRLNAQHGQEVDYILKTVFPDNSTNGAAPATNLVGSSIPVSPQAPTPPSPPTATTKQPIGFRPRAEQTEADPHEVSVLARTRPQHLSSSGGFKV